MDALEPEAITEAELASAVHAAVAPRGLPERIRELGAPQRPATLSRVSVNVIGAIEDSMRNAEQRRSDPSKSASVVGGDETRARVRLP